MAARNDQIVLANGSIIFIATVGYGQAVNFSYYLERGTTRPPSVIDLSGYATILIQKEIITDNDINYFFDAHDETIIDTPEYQAKKERFNNNVVWIWGNSLDSGGVYIRRVSSNTIRLGGISGLVKRTQFTPNKYQYIGLQSDEYNINSITDACFLYTNDDDTLGSNFPVINLMTTAEMRYYSGSTPGQPQTYLGYYVYVIGGYYDYNDMYSTYDPTRYITYHGIPANSPDCYWQTNGYGAPHRVLQTLCPHIELDDNTIWMSGEPWGGQRNEGDDENDDAGTSAESGGGGEYPSETSHVDTPDASSMTTNVINSGFVTLFNPTLAQVKSFNDFLFTNIDDQISQQLKRLWTNPLDYVLFIALAHFTPPSTLDDEITFAGLGSGVNAHKISNQFYNLSCGTVNIPGDTQTFQDYNNFTKVSIYLPYAGIKQLSADDIIGSTVNVTYNIDMLTGNALITIHCNRNVRREKGDAQLDDVIYTFNCNVYETIPLTGTDWRGFYNSVINLATGIGSIAAGGATGNPAAIGSGLGNIAQSIMSEKVNVETSGNMSASYGYMGVQYPYIILERPVTANPLNYRAFKGQVLNMHYKLANLKGYTEIEADTLWIDGFNGITESESQMLKQITSSGFYL
jgi:hypothetical protein